jgi:hypothetical protein
MDFSAVFIHEDSYIELLEEAEPLFHLNMFQKDRALPLREQAYMFIAFRDPTFNQGLRVNVDINGYAYLENEYLVALVFLRNNFTEFMNPHIILASRPGLSDDYIRRNLKGKIIALPSSITIKGKIDVHTMPFEVTPFKPVNSFNSFNPEPIQFFTNILKRPELLNRPEPLNRSELLNRPELLNRSEPLNRPLRETSEVLTIASEEEIDEPGVFKGPRGGKYRIVDGKKIYLKKQGQNVNCVLKT